MSAPRHDILSHTLTIKSHLDITLESLTLLTHLVLLAFFVLLTCVVFQALHLWRGDVMPGFSLDTKRHPHRGDSFSTVVGEHHLTPTLQLIATLNFSLLFEWVLRSMFLNSSKSSSTMMALLGTIALSSVAQACACGLRFYSLYGSAWGWQIGWAIGGLVFNLIVVLMQVVSCAELWTMYGDFMALRALMDTHRQTRTYDSGTATFLPDVNVTDSRGFVQFHDESSSAPPTIGQKKEK